MQCEYPQTVQTTVFGFLRCLSYGRLRKSGEVFLVIYRDIESVCGGKKVTVILDEEFGQFVVYLHKLGFFVGGECSALFRKTSVIFLHKAFLHRSESHLVAAVIDLLYPLEKHLVKIDFVGGIVEQGNCLVGYFRELRSGEGFLIVIEHTRHTLQNGREVFQREDGVVEIRHRAVAGDVEKVCLLLGDSRLDCREEIRCLDFVERRNAILGVVWLHERIFSFLCHNLR